MVGGAEVVREAERRVIVARRGHAAAVGARAVRPHVEDGQAHAHAQARCGRLNPLHDLAHETRPVLERAAVAAWPTVAAQQLVPQVAVAVLHVHEIEPGARGVRRGLDEIVHHSIEFPVGEDGFVGCNPQSRIEHGMPVRDPWGGASRGRPRIPPRVRQLQPDHEVVGLSVPLPVSGHEPEAQGLEVADRLLGNHQLVRICAPIGTDGDGFASPNQLGAALPEALPPAAGEIGRAAVCRTVPAFHRKDAEAIARAQSAALDGTRERRQLAVLHLVVHRQRHPEGSEMRAECVGGLESLEARPVGHGRADSIPRRARTSAVARCLFLDGAASRATAARCGAQRLHEARRYA